MLVIYGSKIAPSDSYAGITPTYARNASQGHRRKRNKSDARHAVNRLLQNMGIKSTERCGSEFQVTRPHIFGLDQID
jgi:hypothetical protein